MLRQEEVGIKQVRSSAEGAYSVTTHNTNELPNGITKGIYLGTAGDLAVTLRNGSEIVFKNLVAGVIHPISAKRIKTTGTTASDILAIY